MPKSTNKRRLILNASLELFARHGYKGTSVNMIATEAGVSQGLLYNFFDGKADLLRELMFLAFQDIQISMMAYHGEPDPKTAIEEHVRATCKVVKEKADFWRLIHAVRLQEGVPGILVGTYRDIISNVTGVLKDLFRKLGYDNPQLEALLFFSQIDGMVILYLQDDRIPIDKLGEHLIKRYKS
jgi:AcrR family transcriptional regulator